MNKVMLMGRLTRDPEVRYTTGENAMCVAKFSLAVDRAVKKDAPDDVQKADFPRCTVFGKSAENVGKYLHQGSKIAVEGRIQTGNYVNKEGQTVYTTDVLVERWEFCESKSASQGSTSAGGSTPTNDFMGIPDNITEEELPF